MGPLALTRQVKRKSKIELSPEYAISIKIKFGFTSGNGITRNRLFKRALFNFNTKDEKKKNLDHDECYT